MLKYLMAYNNHEYGSKGIYRQQCLNDVQSWVRKEYLSSTHGMLKYLMAYNNHEYGSKSNYRQHMECYRQHMECSSTQIHLMAHNNHEYGSKSTYS